LTQKNDPVPGLVRTGIEGLDDVLQGGLPSNRLYLLEGRPGSGKTTLALQFLLAGVAAGESCIYVTLSETLEELRATADGHGWSLDGITVVELVPSEESLTPDSRYTMFHPSEVELGETTRRVLEQTEALKPKRLVFDSMSELRLLAQNSLRYRRQVLALKQFFARQDCTVVLVDDRSANAGDTDLFSLAHGVISIERNTSAYGTPQRQIQISKMRGRAFRDGRHDMRIATGGIVVFPRLVASEHARQFDSSDTTSGIAELDKLTGGGLPRGTSTLLVGPAGTGKSSLSAQFALAAARRGEQVVIFLFEELRRTYLTRMAGLESDFQSLVDTGTIVIQQIDPAEMAPGEFSQTVLQAVEQRDARIVVIDTLNGYLSSMPSEKLLTIHLHELLSALGRLGVTTIMVNAQHGIVGAEVTSQVDASYLADAVITLRYFESGGEVRQAISVIKKRTGAHERSIRELTIGTGGIRLGEPLHDFQGVLTGLPVRDLPGPTLLTRNARA
jgi:circadian clock protein KaiC